MIITQEIFNLSGEFFLFLSLSFLLIYNTDKVISLHKVVSYSLKAVYLNQLVIVLLSITFFLIFFLNFLYLEIFHFF